LAEPLSDSLIDLESQFDRSSIFDVVTLMYADGSDILGRLIYDGATVYSCLSWKVVLDYPFLQLAFALVSAELNLLLILWIAVDGFGEIPTMISVVK